MAAFHWLPSESAPADAPMEIVNAFFHFADGTALYVPSGQTVANGWGEIGSTHITFPEWKEVPVGVGVRWWSLIEDTFYEAELDLPTSDITAMFQQGVFNPIRGQRDTFRTIVLGLAPGGDVSLWLTTGSITHEVMGITAAPVTQNWEVFNQLPDMTRPEVREEGLREVLSPSRYAALAAAPPPPGQWGAWRQRFPWHLRLRLPGAPELLWINSLNGEREIHALPDWQDAWEDRAAPALIRYNWTDSAGDPFQTEITFDPAETFEAFSRFAEARPEEAPFELTIEQSGFFEHAEVALRDAQLYLPLTETTVEVFAR
ncbi:DUF2931 family protein [Alphaproteobacteria bacterium KMM 3653]|uniref:DUF2931 family protein n=1 Tax=Harenicola maris TaxID=2841044 RepID=A0AAP2CQ00_9RHOB|nr:DUF2931 family protein [Harenicola maris]